MFEKAFFAANTASLTSSLFAKDTIAQSFPFAGLITSISLLFYGVYPLTINIKFSFSIIYDFKLSDLHFFANKFVSSYTIVAAARDVTSA